MTDQSILHDSHESLARALAERYRIERELGRGGMATVLLARDLRHDRGVAIKVLHPELSAILGAERFLAEIRLTANLQHPHILPLFDSGVVDRQPYYVMPYVEGETLRGRLTREKQLPVGDAIRIATEVASALDYAHRQGVIHRDVKPENILLHDGQALVADFGIALAVSNAGGTRLTETGLSLGTPHYMSPEQATGDRQLDARSDVYALGAVTYEMLAGDPPHLGGTAQVVIAKILTDEPQPLTRRRPTVPAHVDAAVRTALAKTPADRFPGAAAFAAALATPGFTGATLATPIPGRQAVGRWNLLVAALAGMAAGLIASSIWPDSEPSPTINRQRILLGHKGSVRPITPAWSALSPDGSAIVFSDTTGTVTRLWIKERDKLDAVPIAGTTGGEGPFFSPDGAFIAFAADGKLKKVPRRGGPAVVLADSANDNYPTGTWLADGTILYNLPDWELARVAEGGGKFTRVAKAEATNQGIAAVTALPGARGALFTTCTWNCPVVGVNVLDLRTGKSRMLLDQTVKAWFVPPDRLFYVRRDGTAWLSRFSTDSLALVGEPVSVLDDVRADRFGLANLDLATDGSLIYQVGSTQIQQRSEPVWVDREGTASAVDPNWPPTVLLSTETGLSLSPDGRVLAVALVADTTLTDGSTSIWIKRLGTGPLSRLSFDQGSFDRLEWLPDGTRIGYALSRDGAPVELWSRRADGTGAPRLELRDTAGVFSATWSPDGRWLVARTGGAAGSRDIKALRIGVDSIPRVLLGGPYDERSPALSPDGRWLAYVSDESGRDEVYVRPFPNVDDGKWQVSANGGREPLWAHSGRELFYRRALAAEGALVAVTLAEGPAFETLGERALFPDTYEVDQHSRRYDVSPDDRRFVFIRAVVNDSTPERHLTLVEHWGERLRRERLP